MVDKDYRIPYIHWIHLSFYAIKIFFFTVARELRKMWVQKNDAGEGPETKD